MAAKRGVLPPAKTKAVKEPPKDRRTKQRRKPEEEQLGLPLKQKGRGGRREGAGRKPKPGRRPVPHRARAELSGREPVHVTLRVALGFPVLRDAACFEVIVGAFSASAEQEGIRLTHYSVQNTHLHLIAEASSAAALSRGVQGMKIRMARGLNRLLGRKGPVFEERYHVRVLRTPAEVRNAIAYVLGNGRKHAAEVGVYFPADWADPFAAGPALAASPEAIALEVIARQRHAIVAPLTWLLRDGLKRRSAKRNAPPVPPGGKAD